MTDTRIAVTTGSPRARVDLVVGALAPRLIDRSESHARVALTAAGMILLGGDRVRIEVEVGAGCTLDLIDVGGTVAYPTTAAPSEWLINAHIAEGGALLWQGLPFVVADGADVRRRTDIHLARGATALLRETLVLGRYGERGGRVRSELRVMDADGPLLVEHLDVDAHRPEPGVLSDHRVFDAVTAIGFEPPTTPGVLVLETPGAIARYLGENTHSSPLDATWQSWSTLRVCSPLLAGADPQEVANSLRP